MRTRVLWTMLVTVVALASVACTANKKMTRPTDYDAQLKQRERQISQLESSVQDLKGDLERQQAEARAKAEAARTAEQAARQADERARAAERAARDAERAAQSAVSRPAEPKLALLPPDAAPGQCFARVFVPPAYRSETVQVLERETTERIEIIPARYETVTEKVLVKEASTRIEEVPAQYKWEEERVLVKPAHKVWKKGRGPIEKVDNATGEIMCLVEVPAEYKTVKKKVMVKPPTTRKVEIPAEYSTVQVRKMVSPPKERRIEIPAQYRNVTKSVQLTDGSMEWRKVLCETNMTRDNVMAVQRALQKLGHDPGPLDGVYGPRTRAAVRAFQQSKGLPTGGLTLTTLDRLGVKL